jgi:hypothetical protein
MHTRIGYAWFSWASNLIWLFALIVFHLFPEDFPKGIAKVVAGARAKRFDTALHSYNVDIERLPVLEKSNKKRRVHG